MPEITINNKKYNTQFVDELPKEALTVLNNHDKIGEDFDGFIYLGSLGLDLKDIYDFIPGKLLYRSQVVGSSFTPEKTQYRVIYNGREYFPDYGNSRVSYIGNLSLTGLDPNTGLPSGKDTGEPFIWRIDTQEFVSIDPHPDIKFYIQTRFPDILPGEVQVIRSEDFDGSLHTILRLADMIRKKCPLWYISDATSLKQIVNLNWTDTCSSLYRLKVCYYDGSAITSTVLSMISEEKKSILETALSSI